VRDERFELYLFLFRNQTVLFNHKTFGNNKVLKDQNATHYLMILDLIVCNFLMVYLIFKKEKI